MSDGGREGSKREKVDPIDLSKRASSNEFGREVAKISMAQICENIGFDSSNESALETLTDIMIRYVSDLGKASAFYANIANRSECNVFDLIQGLEDLGSSAGFSGASESTHCLSESGTVREIINFVENAEEIPFSQPVPHFPVTKTRLITPSFTQIGENPSFNHIPSWLPAFPDPHTYIHTPTWNERETDPREDKIELARQRRKAERSLLSLQKRLVSSGSELASTSAHEENGNPFLSLPIQARERDANGVNVLNHVSVLATLSPALEAASGENFRSEDNGRNFISDKRNDVYLSLKGSKKVLGGPVDLRIRRKSSRSSACGEKIDEKDDKKRRAELILRLSTENPQELTQL